MTLFTRGDAQFRKLVGLQGRMREEMGITRVVDTLVLPLADQVRLFDEADVFIAPHGNNNINSLWMRPGTLYVEIRPWCAEMCVLGCDTRFAHSEVGFNATFLDLFGEDAPLAEACGVAGSPFGTILHQRTGVHFHAVSACVGGNRCQRRAGEGTHFYHNNLVDTNYKAWKYNWNPPTIPLNLAMTDLIRAAIDAADDADARRFQVTASSVRATPFAVACDRRAAAPLELPLAPQDPPPPRPPPPRLNPTATNVEQG